MAHLVHQLLERSARRHPDATAVVDGDEVCSYAQLDARANRLAHLLIGLGVGRGDRVGLYLDKSVHAVAGIYGILKAGAAYVPLDPGSPAPRLRLILEDCGIAVVVAGDAQRTTVAELAGQVPTLHHVIIPDADDEHVPAPLGPATVHGPARLTAQDERRPEVGAIDQHLAYILYTSGSTGHPKGVMLTHRNALVFVGWAAREFEVGPDDRLSSHAPLHFDLSVFDLFAAALAGAAVVLVPPRTSVFPVRVAGLIEQQRISVWYSVPSVLTMLALKGGLERGDLPHLRTILFAGEVFPTRYLRTLMGLLPHVRFANLYGPTETNVCTWYEVTEPPDPGGEPIPIGRAIPNVETVVVTDEGTRAAVGEVGELLVRGGTVMRGYWNDPGRTARSLVPDPFGGTFPDPVYRTGDLVREEPDGDYRFLGRRDAQVKSRGYRIELGEVERALYAHPGVRECAVVAVPDDLVTNRLVAFVVSRDGGVDPGELRRFCADRVPHYMVPQTITLRPALARTSTGKVDRRSLSDAAAAAGGS